MREEFQGGDKSTFECEGRTRALICGEERGVKTSRKGKKKRRAGREEKVEEALMGKKRNKGGKKT